MIICTHSHAFFVILHDNWMRKMTKLNEASLKTVQFFFICRNRCGADDKKTTPAITIMRICGKVQIKKELISCEKVWKMVCSAIEFKPALLYDLCLRKRDRERRLGSRDAE